MNIKYFIIVMLLFICKGTVLHASVRRRKVKFSDTVAVRQFAKKRRKSAEILKKGKTESDTIIQFVAPSSTIVSDSSLKLALNTTEMFSLDSQRSLADSLSSPTSFSSPLSSPVASQKSGTLDNKQKKELWNKLERANKLEKIVEHLTAKNKGLEADNRRKSKTIKKLKKRINKPTDYEGNLEKYRRRAAIFELECSYKEKLIKKKNEQIKKLTTQITEKDAFINEKEKYIGSLEKELASHSSESSLSAIGSSSKKDAHIADLEQKLASLEEKLAAFSLKSKMSADKNETNSASGSSSTLT